MAMKKIKTDSKIATKNPILINASIIFLNSHVSSSSLLQAFELARVQRDRPRGMTTDQEQDILRAMLVMACAGLDASLKQLIKDALPFVVQTNPDAQNTLEKFIERKLRGEDEFGTNVKYLARILAGRSPYSRLIYSYIDSLTGDSLQSIEQLFTALSALGIQSTSVNLDKNLYKPIFEARNQIIHELDIDQKSESNKRNIRRVDIMIEWTDHILGLTRRIIEEVDKSIPPSRRRIFKIKDREESQKNAEAIGPGSRPRTPGEKTPVA